MATKPVTFTEDEITGLLTIMNMAKDTYERKAKDPKNPEAIQKIFHTALDELRQLRVKVSGAR